MLGSWLAEENDCKQTKMMFFPIPKLCKTLYMQKEADKNTYVQDCKMYCINISVSAHTENTILRWANLVHGQKTSLNRVCPLQFCSHVKDPIHSLQAPMRIKTFPILYWKPSLSCGPSAAPLPSCHEKHWVALAQSLEDPVKWLFAPRWLSWNTCFLSSQLAVRSGIKHSRHNIDDFIAATSAASFASPNDQQKNKTSRLITGFHWAAPFCISQV